VCLLSETEASEVPFAPHATVALAVPLYEKVMGAAILPMLAALVVGSVTAVVSVVVLAEAAGLPRAVVLSLAPKLVTAGVAMGISESLHADPSLTAVIGPDRFWRECVLDRLS
jgi:putative effector of murein hydrolase